MYKNKYTDTFLLKIALNSNSYFETTCVKGISTMALVVPSVNILYRITVCFRCTKKSIIHLFAVHYHQLVPVLLSLIAKTILTFV